MRAFWIAAFIVLLGGCASTPTDEQKPAGVEDRAPGSTATAPDARGDQGKPVAGVDLTDKKPGMANPLTDPASPLSKRSIFYDFDKYDIKDEYKPLVEVHARYLRENGAAKMLIQGNTDERGSREYNIALGQRRAESVKKLLLLLGAKEDQVEAVSLGEEKPRAPGTSEEAYAQNRRSDILYKGEY